MKIFKRVIIIILLVLFSMISIFIANGFIEKASVDNMIKDFKDRGVFVETIGDTNYYKVLANDGEDGKNVFSIENGDNFIGTTGDIILTNRNPLRYSNTIIIKHLVGFFAKNMFIGHASLNVTDDGGVLLEVTDHEVDGYSNIEDNKGVKYSQNTWITEDDGSPYIIGLRVKQIDDTIKANLVDFASNNIGKPYNKLFITRKDRYYCTDLVSRAYLDSGIKINYDGFFTTGNDMIVSGETYIIFIREKYIINDKEYYNIYYLQEE